MNKLSLEKLEAHLTASDRQRLFEALGIDLTQGIEGQDGWINRLLRPASLGSDKNPSFCINLETGAVKDHGSDYSGDIWNLIQDIKSCSFVDALEWVAAGTGFLKSPKTKWDPFEDGQHVATYSYEDEAGAEVLQVLRFEVKAEHPAKSAKTFLQRHYDPTNPRAKKDGYVWGKAKKQVPYHLPQSLEAKDGHVVFVVEGEKDVHSLEAANFTATCNAGGAGKWQASFADYYAGADIVILPDNDNAGREHAEAVARSLYAKARSVRILKLPGLPKKGDVTDWLNAGHTAEELKELVKACPIWNNTNNDPEPDDEEEIGVLVSEVDREKVKWLWKGRLALGKITILDGDPGLGKSTLYCDIAARITTGRCWPDDEYDEGDGFYNGPENAGDVVIVTCEDGIADTIRPRLEEAGGNLERCRVVQTIPYVNKKGEKQERIPVLPDDLPVIEKAVKQSSATLLVIDPLFAHLAGNVNSYRDQDVRRALTPVAQMAERLGVAVLVIRHLNKAPGGSSLYRGGGSIGIIGQARLALLLGRNPDDEEALVLAPNKSNISKATSSLALRVVSSENDEDVGVIQWEGASPLYAQDLLVVSKGAKNSAVDEATEWLREQLQNGEHHKARDMWAKAENAGLKKKTVRRALKKLGVVVEQIPNKPRNPWYWSLPDGQLRNNGHLASQDINRSTSNPSILAENKDYNSKSQMAKACEYSGVDHLGDICDHRVQSKSFITKDSYSQIPFGTIVRLSNGLSGSVTNESEEGRQGIHLMGSEQVVFPEADEFQILF